jgi:Plavaka transposase
MHRHRQPDCLKAYLQLSSFKKKKMERHPNTRDRHNTRGHKEKNGRTKKQRVEKENDNNGSPNECDISPPPNLFNSSTRQDPNNEAILSFSQTRLLEAEDANLETGSIQSVEAAGKEVGTSNGIQESNPSNINMTDMHTPDPSLLNLYNDINSVLYINNELPLNKFSVQEKVQVDLLRTLKRLKAPLKTFQEVLDWSERAKCAGYRFTEGKPTRKSLLSKLQAMTHLNELQPQTKKLQLPHSKQTVEIVYFSAKAVMTSLLSCPQLNQDQNYLFNGDSPLTPPNPRPNFVGDLNTGVNYIQTHARLIKNPDRDVLLPCILAMDKTHIDVYSRMQMEPLTISYGLMKRNIRSSPMAMRILGYINHQTKKGSKEGNKTGGDITEDEEDGNPSEDDTTGLSQGAQNMNDYHAQVYFILKHSGFTELQQRGFHWNIHYQRKVFPVTFRMYVPFIVGDTEGHDQLCGHYKCRTGNVAQLCRACVCPTKLCGWSKAKFSYRTSEKVNQLIRRQDMEQLKAMSQHYLRSGFRDIEFGSSHNKRGIFGACPGETLHLVLLGWFKYAIEAFVAQAGANSQSIRMYDALCADVGDRLGRQSDRNMPRTHFPNGFCSSSGFMAEEMPGCLLVMLFTFHTSRYREIFSSRSKYRNEMGLGNTAHITDWITLVTSLLQWHAWLKQDTIPKTLVNKSKMATKWLMRQFKFIAPRPTGMKNNTIKFHLVLHLADDILDHGVPQNFNSSFAESAHISLAKDTARNTQKRTASFTYQAAQRYVENLVISKAWNEICPAKNLVITKIKTTESLSNLSDDDQEIDDAKWGRRFYLSIGRDGMAHCKWAKERGGKTAAVKATLNEQAVHFLVENCLPHTTLNRLDCFTHYENKATGERYRAHPMFMGDTWYDFAMVRWQSRTHPKLPARIYTFLDLTNLTPGRNVHTHGNGQPAIGSGMYALIESFEPIPHAYGDPNIPNDADGSDIANQAFANDLVGRFLRTETVVDGVWQPTLYLVHVDSIISPLVGIRDVPPQSKILPTQQVKARQHYLFLLHRRSMWSACWNTVIRNLHQHGNAGDETTEPEDTWCNSN